MRRRRETGSSTERVRGEKREGREKRGEREREKKKSRGPCVSQFSSFITPAAFAMAVRRACLNDRDASRAQRWRVEGEREEREGVERRDGW